MLASISEFTFGLENFELLFQFVARGFGIAAVPQAMVEKRKLPHLRIVPNRKEHALPQWQVGLFRPKTHSQLSPNPPAETFRRMVVESIAKRKTQTGRSRMSSRQPPADAFE